MMHNDPQRPAPTRGVIIVDTSAIVPMAVELTDNFKTKKAKNNPKAVTLCGMLPFLAQNGYEVIIPEMVALEAFVTRNGICLDEFFPASKTASPLFGRARTFLKHVPEFSGNIYIAPPSAQDNSPMAVFARAVWNIVSSKDDVPKKRFRIVSLNKTYSIQYKKDFGDKAACELIRFIKKPVVPIFYLTEDEQWAKNISNVRKDIVVTPLNIFGLYNAILKRNLLQEVGIASVNFKEIGLYTIRILQREETAFPTFIAKDVPLFGETIADLKMEPSAPSLPASSKKITCQAVTGAARAKIKWGDLSQLTHK